MTVIHSETPQPLDGNADIGSSRHPSRADHKHGIDIDAIAAKIAGDFATDAELAAEAQARSLADTEESLARVAADEAEEAARIAADAILQAALVELDSAKAPLASPDLTGTPTAPTAAPDTSTTQIATTAFAKGEADAAQAAAIAASDPAGSAAAAVAAHVAAPDPHTQYTTADEAAAAAPVQSVNTHTGAVVLTAADVGADPAGSAAAAQAASTPLAHVGSGGTAHAAATTSVAGFMSAADKTKLDGVAAGAEVNVNADWNAVSGDAEILNKPTLGTMAAEDDAPIDGKQYARKDGNWEEVVATGSAEEAVVRSWMGA